MKKYCLTGKTMIYEGHVLHRIKAETDLLTRYVITGDLGGWIESTENLSQEGAA